MIFHRFLGGEGKRPCVILHGLLGSSRNWLSAGKQLAENWAVYAPDARNHGQSPHCAPMDYEAMEADLDTWRQQVIGDDPFLLIGHSMGGKTAMRFACHHPDKVLGLVVVDIAVREYAPRWQDEFAAMRSLPLDRIESRGEAEAMLEEKVPDWAFRKFLLTNLERGEDKRFRWAVNLELLASSLSQLFAQPLGEDDRYQGPVLWLRGEHSDFVRDADADQIRRHFSLAQIETVPNAGHNVHFDRTDAFVRAVDEMEL